MSEPFNRALRAAARRSRPAGVCPDAALLAAYADNGVSADERRLIETHAADCAACLEHLALLGAVSLEREAPAAPRSWLAHWGWLVPVATAVLVVAVWVRMPEEKPSQDTRSLPAAVSDSRIVAESGPKPVLSEPPSAQLGGAVATAPVGAVGGGQPAAARAARNKEKADQLTPLERRDSARQVAVNAPPPVAAAPSTPPSKAQEANARKTEPLLDELSDKRAPPAAPAVAAPRAADSAAKDAVQEKEQEQFRAAGPRREADRLMSKVSAAPLVASASPKETFRATGNRIELSEDGGSTWRVAMSVAGETFTAAACAPGGPCWFGTTNGSVLRSTVRPAFKTSTSSLPSKAAVLGITAEGSMGAVVTVEGGQRFRTTDGGTTWQPIP